MGYDVEVKCNLEKPMKSKRNFVMAIGFVCSCALVPTVRVATAGDAPKAPIPLSEYFKIRRLSGASFNFDESLIAYATDAGGRMDVWARPVAGAARQGSSRMSRDSSNHLSYHRPPTFLFLRLMWAVMR